MAIFGFGKKKEESNEAVPSCCCAAGAEKTPVCCGKPIEGICCIKVLGAGCKSCNELLENTQAAVKAMGLPVEVEYITDMQKIMEYGAMRMPALVVNEQVVSMGKVLKAAEAEQLLRKLV